MAGGWCMLDENDGAHPSRSLTFYTFPIFDSPHHPHTHTHTDNCLNCVRHETREGVGNKHVNVCIKISLNLVPPLPPPNPSAQNWNKEYCWDWWEWSIQSIFKSHNSTRRVELLWPKSQFDPPIRIRIERRVCTCFPDSMYPYDGPVNTNQHRNLMIIAFFFLFGLSPATLPSRGRLQCKPMTREDLVCRQGRVGDQWFSLLTTERHSRHCHANKMQKSIRALFKTEKTVPLEPDFWMVRVLDSLLGWNIGITWEKWELVRYLVKRGAEEALGRRKRRIRHALWDG